MVKKKRGDINIQKTVSCPPELIDGHISRLGVTKMHMKERLLSAGERFSSRRRSSFQTDELIPSEYTDGKPVAIVGPVIGLVTGTSARILLEVDRNAPVEMILHKEEASSMGSLADESLFERSKSGFSQRLLGQSSSPAWLRVSKVKRNSTAETVLVNKEGIGSTENSVHSHEDASFDLPDESTSSKQQRSDQLSRMQPGSSTVELWQKLNPGSSQRDSLSNKTFVEGDKTENDALEEGGNSIDSSGSISITKSREKGRSKGVRGKDSLRRRGVRSRSFLKLWWGSSCSSSVSKQSTLYLSQGDGSGSKALGILKEMKEKHPTVFVFTTLEPDSRYVVEVKDCHGAETSSFKTFPTKLSKRFRMASISCNSIFITKKTITRIDDLWHHLSKSIEANKVDLLIHLGDQIYGDGDRHLDAGAGKDLDRWSNRFKIAMNMLNNLPSEEWVSKQEEICEKYRQVYRDTWKHPYTAKCLAHCPSLMIYDDHEIRDNWGDDPRDRRKDCKEYFVARCAWTVTLEYQRQLFEDVDFSNLDAIHKDYYFHVIDKIGLLFLDIRGSRTFHRVENDKTPYLGWMQWKDIDEALGDGGVFRDIQFLVVCSPAPLVFLVPSVTVAAPTVVQRLEDFKGHWSAYKREQRRMVDSLQQWKESRKGREVIVLGVLPKDTPSSPATQAEQDDPSHTEESMSATEDHASTLSKIKAVGLGEPITHHRRGKKSPLQEFTNVPPLPLTLPGPGATPIQKHSAVSEDLPFEELPLGWLQEKYAEFPINQMPAHDISTLQEAAHSSPTHAPSFATPPDPVQEVNLGGLDKPQHILLAAWLREHPTLLDQVVSFMHSFEDVFAWSYKDLEGIPPELGVHTIPLVEGAVMELAFNLSWSGKE
ncbi:hypothetical protein L7F22_003718 [Adiantum nelumboides]|nr:hypothetical protein [Adiantum nelumboides]